MLSVCLIFLYVLFVSYLTGFAALRLIGRFCTGEGEKGKRGARRKKNAVKEPEASVQPGGPAGLNKADGVIMAGLVALTVYAQVFSLFYRVGLLANLALVVFCAAAAVVMRRPLRTELERQLRKLTPRSAIFYLFLFFLFAYGTSRGIIHYDTGLYHAQSIRWAEEYGVVKGLGNLHCRLAYNSSSFCLSALFGFAFLGGQSFHCMAGFLALLLAKVCGEITAAGKRKKLLPSDFARIMGIYYLLIIFDEMVSPASDYFMVLTVFYLVIRWLDLTEREKTADVSDLKPTVLEQTVLKPTDLEPIHSEQTVLEQTMESAGSCSSEESFVPYGLLCLLGVHVMGIKLSAALILLLLIKPAAMLIRKRNGRGIVCFLLLGIGIIAPYLIRNAVISGWLVYPFTFPDLLAVDWKIPKGIADYDAAEIRAWGRGLYDAARYGEPFRSWFPQWFRGQGAVDRLLILGAASASAVFLPSAVVILIRRKKDWYDFLVVSAAVDFSFLFWLLTAPLMRYGCVYVYLASAVTFGTFLSRGLKRRTAWRAVLAGIGLLACYKLYAFGKEVITAYDGDYFVLQKDYDRFETVPYEIGGYTFYYAAEGDRTGYEAFPSSPARAGMRLRGAGIEQGFTADGQTGR